MSTDRFEEIKARADAATPGPWAWFGNTDVRDMRLSTVHSGRLTIMDFVRWGMSFAAPRFAVDGILHRADEFPIYAVCRTATSRKDQRVYRADIAGIRNPDAAFIANSRADVEWLIGEVERLRALVTEAGSDGAS